MSLSLLYLILAAAIAAEVVATTALAQSQSFTRPIPSVAAALGYAAAFYLLSFPLRFMPTGIVYAIWSGLGIVLVTVIGWIFVGQKLDVPALFGLFLIIAGVAVINLFSSTLKL